MRDHGGDLDRARHHYGDGDWLDLSTGINPVAYPLPDLAAHLWQALPTRAERAALEEAARSVYGATGGVVALAGAQAAIQAVPTLATPGRARVLSPTYNEHAAALRDAGWTVEDCETLEALAGADLAVVVNPNNPDGSRHDPQALLALSHSVGLLVVDESFADPDPDLSIAPHLGADDTRIGVLRSFGKFYGLAGLRLGFVLAGEVLADRIRAASGPWPVSGPAIAIGCKALADRDWQAQTTARLAADTARLDALAEAAGWRIVGGTTLFRTYDTGSAATIQERLARAHIWTRIFPYSDSWVRFGLPGSAEGWARLKTALREPA